RSAKSSTKMPTSVSLLGGVRRVPSRAIELFCVKENPRLFARPGAAEPYSRHLRLRAQHRVSVESEERLHGSAVQLLRLAQQVGEFIQAAQRIQPGVAQHGRVAKKTLLDGAGKHLQRHRFFTQVGELTRHVEQAF